MKLTALLTAGLFVLHLPSLVSAQPPSPPSPQAGKAVKIQVAPQDWEAVPPTERERIMEILRSTKLLPPGATVVPDPDTITLAAVPVFDPRKVLCESACNVAEAIAMAACVSTTGVARNVTAACIAAANAVANGCREGC
jgi:hypothetical protein